MGKASSKEAELGLSRLRGVSRHAGRRGGLGVVALVASLVPLRAAADPPAQPESAPSEVLAEEAALAEEEPLSTNAAASLAGAEPALLDVVVVGTKAARAAGSAHVLGSAQLERFEYDDPHAVLKAVPGVYTRGEDGVGLRPNIGLRGVNPDRSKKVALYEDGVPFAPAPYSAPAAYYFPLMTRMAQVKVIKGPSAVAYGPQTVAGAIELLTRPIPSQARAGVDLGYGEYGYTKLDAHLGSSDEKAGFLLGSTHLQNSGFKQLPSGADTGFARNEWMAKARYVPDPSSERRSELTFKLTYSDESSNETYLGLTDSDFRANPDRRYGASQLDHMKWHRTGLQLTHELEAPSGVRVKTTAYRHDLSRTWRKLNALRGAQLFDVLTNPGTAQNAVFSEVLTLEVDSSSDGELLLIGPNERQFVSEGIQTQVELEASTGELRHQLQYAARLHHDRVQRRHSEDAFLALNGTLQPAGLPTVVRAYNEAESWALSLHAVDSITWTWATLTPGVRVEMVRSEFSDRVTTETGSQLTKEVLPGVGAFVPVGAGVGVLAGVYRGFSPPSPSLKGDARAELSTNYEFGARWAQPAARIEVIGFHNDYQNLSNVCTLSSGCTEGQLDRQFDAGVAHITGVEAYAEHEAKAGPVRFPLTLAYTLTRAKFANSFSSDDPIFADVTRGDEMPYVPRHQLSLSASVEHPVLGGNAAFTYVASMREQAGSAPLDQVLATDAEVGLDAGLYHQVAQTVRLYANARNVLNRRAIVSHRPYGARPNAPRWLQVGLKADF